MCSLPAVVLALDYISQISIHVLLGNHINTRINSLMHLNAQRCLPQHQEATLCPVFSEWLPMRNR